ncbi:MAG: TetR/AcrR family transcriptional regulator [Solirubrobacteraceae bacterium]
MAAASPPTKPKLRDRYERRQQQVVRDAARVFAQHGYDQTTIQDLAEALDLAAGGIYHYVGSKEALLRLICDQLMDPLLVQAQALVANPGSPADQLRALLRLWVTHVTEHRDHMLVFQQERHIIEHSSRWSEVRNSRKQFELLVATLIAKVHDSGQLVLADERLALSALLGMVNHTAQWYQPHGRLSAPEIADGYLNLLLGGTLPATRQSDQAAAPPVSD